jgi:hypothetical protein
MRAASSIAKDNFKLVESTLKDATEEMALAVRQAQDRRDRLPLVRSTTEVTALDNYLRPATQAMQRAEQHLLAIEAESRWGKPIAKFQAKRVVAAAAQFLAEQQGIAASVSETALRARQVAMHNDHVAEVARQRQQLGQTIDQGTQWLTSSRNLQAHLSLLKQTLWRHGWVSANTAAVLEQMHHQLVQHDVFTAFEEGKKLIFQVMPAPQTLAEWGGRSPKLSEASAQRRRGRVHGIGLFRRHRERCHSAGTGRLHLVCSKSRAARPGTGGSLVPPSGPINPP